MTALCLCMSATATPAAEEVFAPAEGAAHGTAPAPAATPSPASPSGALQRTGISVPRIQGRLTAQDLGLVINTADDYSVAVGEYYAAARGIPEAHILRVKLPVRPVLSLAEFDVLSTQLRATMPDKVQALALAWTQPYAVECNSITSAVTLGFQPDICTQTCNASLPSRYFNHASIRPYADLGLRPSMLLAARSVQSAKALIDRGVAADKQLGKRGAPDANAVFVNTEDKARSVRTVLFPPTGTIKGAGVSVQLREGADTMPLNRVVIYQTGAVKVEPIDSAQWVPGALADHLTSYAGQLLDAQGQMSALDWLEAGATASYGTVTEPCNHLQKFPHPQVLLLHYLQGASAIEAYWRSVAWPAQGVFVGEPLASPFAR